MLCPEYRIKSSTHKIQNVDGCGFDDGCAIGDIDIESDSESITIKVLSTIPEMKLELAFNRMFKSTSNMFSETMHAIEKGDSEYAQEIVHMDDEINR